VSESETPVTGNPGPDGERLVDLHVDLYPLKAVEQAVAAFAGVADCAVDPHGPYHRVQLRALGGRDATLLSHRFANWALAASANLRG
jgi:hypothetical protein